MTATRPKPRAILHVGPPKTASSALQAWCHANRDVLQAGGIRYGAVDTPQDPKHQWLVQALRRGDFTRLQAEVDALRDDPGQALVLSCEGIMVHRMTVPAAHWQQFREVMSGCETTLFLVRRDPESWLASLWKQQVINPVPPGGRLQVADPQAFARIAGVRGMMDLPGLARDLSARTGAAQAVIAEMATMLDDFRALLALPPEVETRALPRANEALPDAFISVYRQLAGHATDVPALRLAFFALFVEGAPTSNIMLSNVARRFARVGEDLRREALDVLLAALGESRFAKPEDAALARRIRKAALALG